MFKLLKSPPPPGSITFIKNSNNVDNNDNNGFENNYNKTYNNKLYTPPL